MASLTTDLGDRKKRKTAIRQRSSAKIKNTTKKAIAHPIGAHPVEGYSVDDQIGYMLRVAFQQHTSIFNSMMIEGLTQAQFAALTRLIEVGPCSHNRLGRLIALDAPTIKGVIDRLRARGLLVSEADPNHRTRRNVRLTAQGLRTTRKAIEVGKRITERTIASLSPGERDAMTSILRRIGGQRYRSV
jgi:MarR family transcriptional regulator, lower aerobic nicotinate degradation pathway regulator